MLSRLFSLREILRGSHFSYCWFQVDIRSLSSLLLWTNFQYSQIRSTTRSGRSPHPLCLGNAHMRTDYQETCSIKPLDYFSFPHPLKLPEPSLSNTLPCPHSLHSIYPQLPLYLTLYPIARGSHSPSLAHWRRQLVELRTYVRVRKLRGILVYQTRGSKGRCPAYFRNQ